MTYPVPDPVVAQVIARDARAWARRSRAWGRDFDEANLVAEGWVVAMRVLARWDPSRGAALSTYLSQALRNRYSDMLTAARRRPTVPLTAADELSLVAPPDVDLDLWVSLSPSEHAWLTAWTQARGNVRVARAALGWDPAQARAVRQRLQARLA